MLKILLILFVAMSMARCARIDPCGPLPTEGGTVVPRGFTSVEGRFKIALPQTPQNKQNADDNSFDWYIFNRGQFHIVYYDRKQGLEEAGDRESVLNDLRDLTRSKGGQVEVDSEIKLNGHPGREIRIRDERGLIIQRMYYVDQRLYIITAFVPPGLQCAVTEVVKTLDTFEILEEKAAASTK